MTDFRDIEAPFDPPEVNTVTIECPCCGDDGATSDADGFFYDGQELECGCDGHVSCCFEIEPYIRAWDCEVDHDE